MLCLFEKKQSSISNLCTAFEVFSDQDLPQKLQHTGLIKFTHSRKHNQMEAPFETSGPVCCSFLQHYHDPEPDFVHIHDVPQFFEKIKVGLQEKLYQTRAKVASNYHSLGPAIRCSKWKLNMKEVLTCHEAVWNSSNLSAVQRSSC
jgi:hypothetical protein